MTRVPDRPEAGQSLRRPSPAANHGPRYRHQVGQAPDDPGASRTRKRDAQNWQLCGQPAHG